MRIATASVMLFAAAVWPAADATAQIEAMRAEIQEVYSPASQERADIIEEAMLAPVALPDTRPAMGPVLVGTDGRLWVSRFKPDGPAGGSPRQWHILAPSGEPLAKLVLPEDAELRRPLAGRVVLVVTDEWDVEHLEVRELVGGAG